MATDPLSLTFAALADPTRRAILARLAAGEATVGELAEPFDLSAPAITKHLKVLQRAGLVTQTRQAQLRPCRLAAKPLQDVSAWVEQYRQFWEERLDRLGEYLKQLQSDLKPPPGDAPQDVPRRAAAPREKPTPQDPPQE